jgi:hypothetical protein
MHGELSKLPYATANWIPNGAAHARGPRAGKEPAREPARTPASPRAPPRQQEASKCLDSSNVLI